LKDEPKPSFNQVPLFVSHTLTSDRAESADHAENEHARKEAINIFFKIASEISKES
jgi:hypothetical protein